MRIILILDKIMNNRFLVSLLLLVVSVPSVLAEEVNIYSYRQSFLIDPILEEFTKNTGIKTNVVFAKKGLIERLKREGKFSPADIVLTSNFSKLLQLQNEGLTQNIDTSLVANNIPAQYRDPSNQWIALTKRVRNIYTSKDRLSDVASINYEDLVQGRYKGKICTRSGKHPYNLGLISSMIAHKGEEATQTWLEGVKANLARKPQGNDRAQVKAIKEGLCDVSLGNSYYYGKMMMDSKQKAWAEAVTIQFPNQDNRGAHINVSGVVIAKHSPNKVNAQKLVNFLTGDKAQQMYASKNMEYPVKENVALSDMVSGWGSFKEDSMSIAEISKYRSVALKMIDKIKFDL